MQSAHGQPDLTASVTSLPSSAQSGSQISIGWRVVNNGSGSAGASGLRLYISTNSSLGSTDTYLSPLVSIPSLSSGDAVAGTTTRTLPNLSAGTWYLLAQADGYDSVTESNEGNNVSSRSFTITTSSNSTEFGGTVRNSSTSAAVGGASVVWGSYYQTTSPSGSFSFTNLPCETNTLYVSKSGFSTYSQSYTPDCNTSNVKNVYLTPESTTSFGGTVRDSTNNTGISNATVEWGSYTETTSSSGTFSFSSLPCETHVLTVSKSGYSTYSQTYTPACGTSNERNISLSPLTTTFGGTVRDATTGALISNATVQWGSHTATTNSGGAYSFPSLPCETHILTVSRSGYSTYSQSYTPACNASNDKNISLSPLTTAFGGTVRDATTNAGVSGATVQWGSHAATTNSGGTYSFPSLPCETHVLTVSRSGYATYSQSYTPACNTSNDKNISLSPLTTTFSGTVRDATTNDGISSATVQWGSYAATTSSSGTYSLPNIPCETHILTVSKAGYSDYSQAFTPTCHASTIKDVALTELSSGTTVITHGFRTFGTVPDWMYELAVAIRARATASGGGSILQYDKETGQLEPCSDERCGSSQAGTESIIVFDWADDSNDAGEGYSEAAAEALFAALVEGSRQNPPQVDLTNLHLIGHSRGTVVNSEVAERLIAADFPAPRQITSLDPHDWGGYTTAFVTETQAATSHGVEQDPDSLALGYEDFDVNEEHPEYKCGQDLVGDPSGVCAWQDVLFHDNYFQTASAGLEGRPIRGAANLDLSAFDGLGIKNIDHASIHDWYHCTVDPDTTAVTCDPGWFQDDANACTNLSTGIPAARLSTFAIEAEGFFFSRLGGGTDSRCSETGFRQEVKFDFGLREGLVNGDFEKNGSGGLVMPGWSYHGGGGDARAYTPFGNNYLLLEAGQARTHNRFFLPEGATEISYCWQVVRAGAPETLRFVLIDDDAETIVGQQQVGTETDWVCSSAPVASAHRGTVRRLRVELVGPNPSSVIVVGVDALGIGIAGPCTYSITPSALNFPATGDVGSFSVMTASGCTWSVTDAPTWVSVTTEGGPHEGAGSVSYTVTPNTEGPRSGVVVAAGRSHLVMQDAPPPCYPLSLGRIGSGSLPTASPSSSAGCEVAEYTEGEIIQLAAAPATGWTVSGWTGTDDDTATSTTNTVTMPASPHAASVSYVAASQPCYTLTLAKAGAGAFPTASPASSVGCASGQYLAGESITLSAIPEAGWTVGGWIGTDDNTSTAFTGTLTMPAAAHTAGVIYVETSLSCHPLTLLHTGSGSPPTATPSNSTGCAQGSYLQDEWISVSATPDPGWSVGGWSGTDNDGSTSTTNTLTMPAADHVVSVFYVACSGTDPFIQLQDETVLSTRTFAACDSIMAGPNLYVAGSGRLRLIAGRRVSFSDGFEVSGPDAALVVDVGVTPSCSTVDSGGSSSLRLVGGLLNGTSLSPGHRTIEVAPGEPISGSVDIEINSTFPSNAVMALGMTPTWGPHFSSYADLGHFYTPVSGLLKSIPVSYTAPAAPGTYNIILAFRGEFNAGQVLSATNWSHGPLVWDNGDDVAGWSRITIERANRDGTVCAEAISQPYFFPATAIEVRVTQTR